MKEYIEREAAKDKFSDHLPIGRSIRSTLDEIPTADVAPVIHGEWISLGADYNDINIYKCSVCGVKKYGRDIYCSRCGALMNGGK